MAGIQTSNVTTAGGGDLTIQPGGQTQVKSILTNNPGVTPVAAAADGTLKKMVITDLSTKAELDDNDWVLIHDSTTGQTKRVAGSEIGGGAQNPFADPLPETGAIWEIRNGTLAVRANGSGSTADLRNSVEFAVNNNTYNQANKNVTKNTSTVKVRWVYAKLDAAAHGQTVSGELYETNERFFQIWNLTLNKQPFFSFTRIETDVNTTVTSNITTATDMNWRAPVTVAGGTLSNISFSIQGQAFGTSGYIEAGQTIQVKGTAGGTSQTTYTAIIDIGGHQETWDVYTVPSPTINPATITSPASGSYACNTGQRPTWRCNNPSYVDTDPPTRARWDIQNKNTSSPVSGYPTWTTDLTQHTTTTNLSCGVPYRARVKHANDDVMSEWSAWHETYNLSAPPPPPPPPPPAPPPPPSGGGGSCGTGTNLVSVAGAGGWDSNPLPRDHREYNRGWTIATEGPPAANANCHFDTYSSRSLSRGGTPRWSSRGCRAWSGNAPSQPSNVPSCAQSAGTGGYNDSAASFWSKFQSGSQEAGSYAQPQRASMAPCARSLSSVGTVEGVSGGASAGDILSFVGLQYDNKPLLFTNILEIGVSTFKHVADDGSEGNCGGTEETIDYWIPRGATKFKWPAEANELLSTLASGRKVTEVTFVVRLHLGFQGVTVSDPQEIGTIYAVGCP